MEDPKERRYYCTQEKLQAISRVKAGERQYSVAHSMGISRHTLGEWIGQLASTDWINSTKLCPAENDLLDRALYSWFIQQLQAELKPNLDALIKKSNVFATRLFGNSSVVNKLLLEKWCSRHCVNLDWKTEPGKTELEAELTKEQSLLDIENRTNGESSDGKPQTEKKKRRKERSNAGPKQNSDSGKSTGQTSTSKTGAPPAITTVKVRSAKTKSTPIKNPSAPLHDYSRVSNETKILGVSPVAQSANNDKKSDSQEDIVENGDMPLKKRMRRDSNGSEKENHSDSLKLARPGAVNTVSKEQTMFSLALSGKMGLARAIDCILHCLKPDTSLDPVFLADFKYRLKVVDDETQYLFSKLSTLERYPTNFRAALRSEDERLVANLATTKKYLDAQVQNNVKLRDGMLPSDVDDNLLIEYTSDVVHYMGQNKLERQHLPPFGQIIRKELKAGMQVFAAKSNTIGVWLRAKILEPKIVNVEGALGIVYKVKFDNKKQSANRMVPPKLLAYAEPPNVTLPVGSRVIARYKDDTGEYASALYAGIIAEPPKSTNNLRYLIFFDDGYAQYVRHFEVYLVCSGKKEVWEEVHEDSRSFIKSYLKQYPERPMVKLNRGQNLLTEWNGRWWNAKVNRVDGSLVEMYFDSDKRSEWIYRGSTRLAPLFNELNRTKAIKESGKPSRRHNTSFKKKDGPYVEYTRDKDNSDDDVIALDDSDDLNKPPEQQTARKHTAMPPAEYKQTARKSTTQDISLNVLPQKRTSNFTTTIDPSTALSQKGQNETCEVAELKRTAYSIHTCTHNCITTEDPTKHKGQNPLRIPMLCGWQREVVKQRPGSKRVIFYKAPCGRRFRHIAEVSEFLNKTRSKLTIDLFSYDVYVHTFSQFRPIQIRFYIKDMTYGKEPVPVCCVNSLDKSNPPYVEYASKRFPAAGVTLNLDKDFLCGCDCDGDCSDREKCQCQQLTVTATGATPSGINPGAGYKFRRLNEPLVTGIYECNQWCKCKASCRNRVAQNGLLARLQVFKTEQRGWGIRCLDDIPRGMFICIYAGQLLNEELANEDGNNYGDEYQAELDHIEVVERYKEGYESDNAEEIEKKQSDDEFKAGSDSDDDEDDEDGSRSGIRRGYEFDSSINLQIPKSTNVTEAYTFRKRTTVAEKLRMSQDSNNSSKSRTDSDNDDDCIKGPKLSSSFGIKESKEKSTPVSLEPLVPKFRSTRSFFGKEEYCYIMDAKICGNIGRYLNHSCCPNVFVQNVFVDTHDLRFPWVAFFASTYIRAGTELTWDYNYDVGSVPGKVMYCHCGAAECRGRLL